MEHLILTGTDRQRFNHFVSRMNHETAGSEKWEQLRKIVAWLAEKLRAKQKLENYQ